MKEFVISCNVEKYDVTEDLEYGKDIFWKQCKDAMPGDRVFVYCSRPYSKLRYLCEVKDSYLSSAPDHFNIYGRSIRYMIIRMIRKLPENGLDLYTLKDNGLKTVQCSTVVSDELHLYLQEVIGGNDGNTNI